MSGRDFTQDPRKQGKLRDLQKRREEQRKADLGFVMRAPQGRRFMHGLIFDGCELFSVYPGQDSGIYRHEGRREVGFRLAKEIQETLPEEWLLMVDEYLTEADDYRKQHEAALTNSNGDSDA